MKNAAVKYVFEKELLLLVLLLLLACGLIIYGAAFNTADVFAEAKSVPALRLSEGEMMRDVTVGGLSRSDGGKLMRTYSGKPPSFCPT